ncbi:hypothetical protein H6F78_10960 [Coleofasciculus sp. FACHB-64]|uniref:hypothetical protein n=1 Tax=Cyanophyceae TaxID=3028117 RepID=UPI00168871F6|nr:MULTISPECIES: hypothetical protein [unclassified Coleofasciculus]MBD1838225.1 hypothetical protein [Coleofasciculus sp. FACHB-501]MBD1889312.1 hypothetical protein [Coleofasciculus sp. FACHB-SPT9]MBD1897588.1 hypothetical protein [Coleofasciculus sp. FACHB-129]MBD2046109.1 hypothetical protein [Coleofasciculus sp. FACHB-64]
MMRGKPEVGLLISPLHFVDLYALVSLSRANYAGRYKRLHKIGKYGWLCLSSVGREEMKTLPT